MERSTEDVESIATLSTCIRALNELSALPNLWLGEDPSVVVRRLLGFLVESLDLAFAYVRLHEPHVRAAHPAEHLDALASALAEEDPASSPRVVTSPIDRSLVTVSVHALPPHGGQLVAASHGAHFPTWSESMLIATVANQLGVWTQVTRQLHIDDVLSDEELRRRERANLVAALAKTSGRIYGVGGAAELLGLKPSTLQSRLRAFGIRPRERTPIAE